MTRLLWTCDLLTALAISDDRAWRRWSHTTPSWNIHASHAPGAGTVRPLIASAVDHAALHTARSSPGFQVLKVGVIDCG
ncbi:hypothetical protein F4801DRAFT_568068 [Xylaria longipes]|nr:hypothetical protein F4801DRAFT_568068 [Xylaria longipes]